MSEHEFLQTAYRDESIKDYVPPYKEYNGTVLPCNKSKLVGVLLDNHEMVIYTIDCDLMIRVWSLGNGGCLRSYVIETREDQIAEANQRVISEANPKQNSKKAQIVRADNKKEFMIVAFEGGEIQVNQLKTGVLLYNDHNVNPIKIENEIAQMKFFESQSKYWVAVGCWQGKVAFLSRPVVELGKHFLKYKNCLCSHSNDVLTLDINQDNQLVTGSLDNTISFWDTFSAVESKTITLPESIAPSKSGRQIQYVRFPFRSKKQKNLLLIVMNRGQCYILETQSEKILKFYKDEQLDQEIDDSDECSCHDDSDGELSDEFNASHMDSNMKQSQHVKEEDSMMHAQAKTQKSSIIGSSGSPGNAGRGSQASRTSNRSMSRPVTQTEKPLAKKKTKRDPYLIARVSPHPALSIEKEYIASVTDTGKGRLHKITCDPAKAASGKDPAAAVEMELVGRFRAGSGRKYDSNVVFQIDLCTCIRIFMTSQVDGEVQIFSLDTCDKIAALNQPRNGW